MSSYSQSYRWYSERQINTKSSGEKSSATSMRNNHKLEADSMMSSPYHAMNNDSMINKSGFNSSNLHLNNANSNLNNGSISNSLMESESSPNITNHQVMTEACNNVINNGTNMNGCNKLQLPSEEHSNLNVFITNTDASSQNISNENIIKDDNYKNHMMNGSQKFNSNSKHISCQQQQQQQNDSQSSIIYGQMLNDINGSSLPMNLRQVSVFIPKHLN